MELEKNIVGTRISIRSYTANDRRFMEEMWFDEENGRYMSDPTREYIDKTYENALNTLQDSTDGWYMVIVLNDTETPIGSCCAFPDENGAVYDIGYCIHKSQWKHGYGSEAVSLLEKWIVSRGGKAITAEVATENTASNALLRKLGYRSAAESEFKKYNMDISYNSYIYRKEL